MTAKPDKNALVGMAALRPNSASPASHGAVAGMCILLAAAVFLVFGQSVRHDFVNYDDEEYFYSNPHILTGLNGNNARWAFRTEYAGNWHPMTWLSFMLDVEFFGTDPAGPHLTNVLLHATSTVLLFLVLKRMTGAYWRSAVVAALFGLHPLRVESVVWVAERKDVLSGLFFMLTLLMYASYARCVARGTGQMTRTEAVAAVPGSSPVTRHPSLFYLLALLFFALGLMSKPMLVTLPLVLLLLDYWPLNRFALSTFNSDASRAGFQPSTRLRLVLEKLPFLVLSVAAAMVTVFVQREGVVAMEKLSLGMRMGNAAVTYITYLDQMVRPVRLAVFYPYSMSAMWTAALALFFLAGISAGVFGLRRQHPYLLAGWLWYLGMLLPVIGLVQVGGQGHADRYTYLPLIGVFIMLAWAAVDFIPAWRYRHQMLSAGAVGVILALMACAWQQTSYWRNSESLWVHTLACTSRNYVAHNDLALVLAQQGRYAEALQHYQTALEINPHYAEAHNSIGIMLAQQGRLAEAIQHFQRALEIKPTFVAAHNSMGNALADQKRYAEAIKHYQRALETNPDSAEAHYNLGNVLALQGRYAEAIEHFQRTLQINPDDVKARNSLDAALALQGKPTKEIEAQKTQ